MMQPGIIPDHLKALDLYEKLPLALQNQLKKHEFVFLLMKKEEYFQKKRRADLLGYLVREVGESGMQISKPLLQVVMSHLT
ncbi:hypothetical protein AAG747_19490 [Rapidithrix thailandica]|uniref:Uncharacterized protein n=1 Tax=Rapidithrix thailandica TaxID=413964 RepID=A0AAW9S1X7_9BACT